jgi:predicted GIY-YIG superfamily endonuclease
MSKPSPSGNIRQFEPQVLYRFWQNETLLYIGISQSFLSRMDQHYSTKVWFKFITNITLEHFPTRYDVEQAEKQAIKREAPLFNLVHNTKNLKGMAQVSKLENLMPDDYFYNLPDTRQERKVFIEGLKTEKGGYTRLTLSKLKVPYPPPKKWRTKLIEHGKLVNKTK